MTIAEVTRRYTLARLKANDGDKATTAKELGISLKTLYNWLNAWEMNNQIPANMPTAQGTTSGPR